MRTAATSTSSYTNSVFTVWATIVAFLLCQLYRLAFLIQSKPEEQFKRLFISYNTLQVLEFTDSNRLPEVFQRASMGSFPKNVEISCWKA